MNQHEVNGAGTWPSRTVAAVGITVLVVLLQCLPPDWRAALRYEHAALAQGQLWRALTGHVLHLGWTHMALNLAGLWLCCALAGLGMSGRQLLSRLLVLALGVSVLLYGLSPQVSDYVGLSGVLYGLLLWALLPQAVKRDALSVTALMVLLAWTAWQVHAGANPLEEARIGGRIIVQAHLYGLGVAAAGWLASVLTRWAQCPPR
jgi:rhomboid family GlyGly-CTERM serine protease